jgi:hypothetical protein
MVESSQNCFGRTDEDRLDLVVLQIAKGVIRKGDGTLNKRDA